MKGKPDVDYVPQLLMQILSIFILHLSTAFIGLKQFRINMPWVSLISIVFLVLI